MDKSEYTCDLVLDSAANLQANINNVHEEVFDFNRGLKSQLDQVGDRRIFKLLCCVATEGGSVRSYKLKNPLVALLSCLLRMNLI